MDFVGFKAAILSLDAKLQDVTAGRVHIEQTQNSIDPPFIQLFICKNNKRKEKNTIYVLGGRVEQYWIC